MPLVLAENEATESGIRYQDRTGVSYQFPKMYLRLMQPGERFVYYRGRKRQTGGRAPQVYFGTGIVGTVRPDPTHTGRFLCDVLDYIAFGSPVFFRRGPSDYLESGGERRGYFQQGVRTISEYDFAAIMAAAGAQAAEQAPSPDIRSSMYGAVENNIEIERFALDQALARLRSRYPLIYHCSAGSKQPRIRHFGNHWQGPHIRRGQRHAPTGAAMSNHAGRDRILSPISARLSASNFLWNRFVHWRLSPVVPRGSNRRVRLPTLTPSMDLRASARRGHRVIGFVVWGYETFQQRLAFHRFEPQ